MKQYQYSLFNLVIAEVQVAVANPLDLEPILVVVVAAATELNLGHIQRSLHEASSWRVCVFVVLHSILQAFSQGEVQRDLHQETQQSRDKEDDAENQTPTHVGLQYRFPLGELDCVKGVMAHFAPKSVDTTGHESHQNEQVGHEMALVVIHHLASLAQLDLEEDPHAEDEDSSHDGEPVQEPQSLG